MGASPAGRRQYDASPVNTDAPNADAPNADAPNTGALSDDASEEGDLPGADGYMDLIRAALAEDHAADDVTTAALVDATRTARAEMIVKAPGVVCGLQLIEAVYGLVDPDVRVELLADDGDTIGAGTVVARVEGPAAALLRGERTVLNFVQRLSGVATRTADLVELAMASGPGIYDTRKTTPGWRALEKYAVRCGGGHNHRMHLADAAMIKENHLVAAYGATGSASIATAVRTLLAKLPAGIDIYVEVENGEELDAAIEAAEAQAGRLVIMLDDFELEDIRAAVARLRRVPPPRPRFEITGGVTLDRIEALASTGVHRISSGALTHSAPALDISLKIRSAQP